MMTDRARTLWARKIDGRRKRAVSLFQSRSEFYQALAAYIDWTIRNPVIKPHFDPATGNTAEEHCQRPPTAQGFCTYLGIGAGTWSEWGRTAADGTESTLAECVRHAKEIFNSEVIDLSLHGVVNATITTRLAGLADKQEINQRIDGAGLYDDTRLSDMVENLDRGLEDGLGPKEGERPTAATEMGHGKQDPTA